MWCHVCIPPLSLQCRPTARLMSSEDAWLSGAWVLWIMVLSRSDVHAESCSGSRCTTPPVVMHAEDRLVEIE